MRAKFMKHILYSLTALTMGGVQPAAALTLEDLALQIDLLNSQIKELNSRNELQQRLIDTLTAKTACVSGASGTNDFVFEGCNVHIRNGYGTTASVNASGNLILGYNKNEIATRKGSHNIVVGDLHEYNSYGGIVTGNQNTLEGPNAAIISATDSKVSVGSSAIIGGNSGIADGVGVIVSGRRNYIGATASFSAAIGGVENKATGGNSVALGGIYNTASGGGSVACGGAENNASGSYAVTCGGSRNNASALHSAISGGTFNFASGRASSVSGGYSNSASGNYSSVLGGYARSVTTVYGTSP